MRPDSHVLQLLKSLGARADRPFWLTAAVLALAAFLRLHAIGTQPLWVDEGYSWWDARQSLADLWHLVPQCDPHPPLYFALLKGWIGLFGDGIVAMRALSALLGIATTWLLMRTGRLISPEVGLVAGLLFALTPFQVEFANEARPYALLCFGSALMLYGCLKTLTEPTRWFATGLGAGMGTGALRGWIALGAGAIICIWSNNTSILLVASVGIAYTLLFALHRQSRRMIPAFVTVMAVVALLWAPYLPTLWEQARGVVSDFWIQRPTPGWRIINELRFVVSLSIYEWFWAGLALLLAGVLLLYRRGRSREALFLASLAMLPALLSYAFSMTLRPIFISRALITLAPAIVLAFACAVGLLRWQRLRLIGVGLLVTLHAGALVAHYARDLGKEPWDQIAAEVSDDRDIRRAGPHAAGAGPIVLTAANELALPLEHALQEIDSEDLLTVKGAPADFPAPGLRARYPSGKCAPAVRDEDMPAIARAVRDRSLVWFVTRRSNVYDPDNRIVAFLSRLGWKQVQVRRYMPGFLEVYKFARAPRPVAALGGESRSELHRETRFDVAENRPRVQFPIEPSTACSLGLAACR